MFNRWKHRYLQHFLSSLNGKKKLSYVPSEIKIKWISWEEFWISILAYFKVTFVCEL